MNETDRQSQLNRLRECIRLAEAAYDELYEPRTLQPAGPYSDVKEFYGEAIGLARKLGLSDEVQRLEKRLAEIREIARGQMSRYGSGANASLVRIWPPTAVADEAREAMRRLIHSNSSYVLDLGLSLTTFGFTYDAETVKWLDGLINYLRDPSGPIDNAQSPLHDYDQWARTWRIEDRDDQVSLLGAYLGAAIIENFGGEWDLDDQGWHVRFDEANRAYALRKVAKQLASGAADSIFAFYSSIPLLFGRPCRPTDYVR